MLKALQVEQSIHDDMERRGSMPSVEWEARKADARKLRAAAISKADGRS